MNKMQWLLLVYIALLAVIIGLANHGGYGSIFSLIRQIPYGDKFGHFFLMGFSR